jgi:hypothetical protein
MNPVPEKIIWIYGQWQSAYESLRSAGVIFKPGIDSLDDLTETNENRLVILDDVMHEADDRVTKLFTKGSHHANISVMFLVQNLFHGGNKEHRTISLNAQYVVVFKNPRDARQIEHLATQMYPGRVPFLREAFKDATDNTPHSYLLLDLKQDTPDALRVRTDLFHLHHHPECGEMGCVGDTVYVPKDYKRSDLR